MSGRQTLARAPEASLPVRSVGSVNSIYDDHIPFRFAAKCVYLQMTMGSHRQGQGLINLCRHIIRDGSECVGPFLDDAETDCGLWEQRNEPNRR
jgi:hypothetical protein